MIHTDIFQEKTCIAAVQYAPFNLKDAFFTGRVIEKQKNRPKSAAIILNLEIGNNIFQEYFANEIKHTYFRFKK